MLLQDSFVAFEGSTGLINHISHSKTKPDLPFRMRFAFLSLITLFMTCSGSLFGQCPTPVTTCLAAHQTAIDLSTIPQCGTATVDFVGDIEGTQTDCNATANNIWHCHQFIITRPANSTTQQFVLKVGQGSGCNGELDATYALINGLCTQLSNGGSQTSITFTFPYGINTITLDLCLNSSAFVKICNMCTAPPPCTTLPLCSSNISDINTTGCQSSVPAAFTSPSSVFTNTGTCGASLVLKHTDVGDVTFCGSGGAGVNFVRTYSLYFIDTNGDTVLYRQCPQNIHVTPSPPVITPGTIAACYPSLAAAQAAALAAATATDCGGTITETASATGTCNAVVTVTESSSCGST
ncbi:MAG: hypothetical protein ABJB16_11705, partial [Saprospiraceae bacterium]